MSTSIDPNELHRTAKYFMDNGRAQSHEAAMAMLESFGLNIVVGAAVANSIDHQVALLTLVNLARRTFLGGIRVVRLPDTSCLSSLASHRNLAVEIQELGGVIASEENTQWPTAVIGSADSNGNKPIWHLTWEGWRGGVVPAGYGDRLSESHAIGIAPALAAAACAAEVFAYFAGDHVLAGKRPLGMSLWQPDRDWLVPDRSEPPLSFLPSRLWIIGLGNLGQAFAWLLAALPYPNPSEATMVLQDFDVMAPSNDSTSALSSMRHVGQKKTRVIAQWLEERGFSTVLEERRFGARTNRIEDEPAVALCGVDNANTRLHLDRAGFDLVVEAGLGAGPEAFRSISMHTFPGPRSPVQIWGRHQSSADAPHMMPAYEALKEAGMDECGLTRLASRSVGVPFVGLMAGCLVISELLRRLHGGMHIEQLATSVLSPSDMELSEREREPYAHGHLAIERQEPLDRYVCRSECATRAGGL